MHCKRCQSTYVKLSRRNGVERTASLFLPVQPYRCGTCFERFYGLAKPIFNLTRSMTAGLIGLLVLLIAANHLFNDFNEAPRHNPNGEQRLGSVAKIVSEQERAIPTSQPDVALTKAAADPFPSEIEQVTVKEFPEEIPEGKVVVDEPGIDLHKDMGREGNPEPVETAVPAETPLPGKKQEPAGLQRQRHEVRRILQTLRIDRRENAITVFLSGDNIGADYDDRLSNTTKIVIDLPGRWKLNPGIRQHYSMGSSEIDQLRLGLHDDFVRLVFDHSKDKSGSYQVTHTASGLAIVLTDF